MLLMTLRAGIMVAKLCEVLYLTTLPVAEYIASVTVELNMSIDYWR